MKTPRNFDPRSLEVEAFAEQAGQLAGREALASLLRLVDSAHPEAPPSALDQAVWEATGQRVQEGGGPPQTWIHLRAQARLQMTCQRCLQPVAVEIEADRRFRFVVGEAEAARLDAESDDDVLPTSRSLDLVELVEDELLLALPLVPRHHTCPQPLLAPQEHAAAPVVERDNPFAVLAGVKFRKRGK